MTNRYNQEEYLIKNGERFTILKKRKDGPKQIEELCKLEDLEFGRKIAREVAAFAPQNKKSCEIYYLQIFRNYLKLSLSGIDRICYDHFTYSIEGNL
jgi:hypothetical protein